jgi:hypothetical protein
LFLSVIKKIISLFATKTNQKVRTLPSSFVLTGVGAREGAGVGAAVGACKQ